MLKAVIKKYFFFYSEPNGKKFTCGMNLANSKKKVVKGDFFSSCGNEAFESMLVGGDKKGSVEHSVTH